MPPQAYGPLPWGMPMLHQGQPFFGGTFPGAHAPPPSVPIGSHNQFVPLQVRHQNHTFIIASSRYTHTHQLTTETHTHQLTTETHTPAHHRNTLTHTHLSSYSSIHLHLQSCVCPSSSSSIKHTHTQFGMRTITE